VVIVSGGDAKSSAVLSLLHPAINSMTATVSMDVLITIFFMIKINRYYNEDFQPFFPVIWAFNKYEVR
jgi:hypothetical protein